MAENKNLRRTSVKLLRLRKFDDRSAIVTLFALTMLFFWPYVAGFVSFPWDIMGNHYPWQYSLFEWLREGRLILWNPYFNSGYPLIANSQVGAFYPFNWLFLAAAYVVGDFSYAFVEANLITHIFLAGVFTFVACRRSSMGLFGSFVAALIYEFGGFFVSQAEHLGAVQGMAWLPLIVTLGEEAFVRKKYLHAGLAGAVLGLTMLAGHPPTALAVGLALFLVFCWRLTLSLLKGLVLETAKLVRNLLFAIATGLGIAAVQVLPTLQFALLSIPERGAGAATNSGPTPPFLITFLIPNFFGSHFGPGPYWAPFEITWTDLYVGVFPLVLVVLALANYKKKRVLMMFAFILFGILEGFSGLTLFPQLFSFTFSTITNLPIVRQWDFIALTQFGVAFVAGRGAEIVAAKQSIAGSLLKAGKLLSIIAIILLAELAMFYPIFFEVLAKLLVLPRLVGVLAIAPVVFLIGVTVIQAVGTLILQLFTSAALLMIGGRNRIHIRTFKILVIIFIFVDLMIFGSAQRFNSTPLNPYLVATPVTGFAANNLDTRLLSFLQSDKSLHRVDFNVGESQWRYYDSIWHLQVIGGSEPFLLQDYFDMRSIFSSYEKQVERLFTTTDYNSRILDILNVKYVVTTRPISELDSHVNGSRYVLVYDNYYKVYRNKTVLPRAIFVPSAIAAASDVEAGMILNSSSYDPSRYVVLSKGDLPPPGGIDSSLMLSSAFVIISNYSAGRISLKIQTSGGFLLLSEIYFPGWQAYVDGAPSKVLRADIALCAIPISSGTHTVEFLFESPALRNGAAITAITVAILIGIVTHSSRLAIRAKRY